MVKRSEDHAFSALGYAEVEGDCGLSWLGLKKDGKTLEIGTGYYVPLPVTDQRWGVVGAALSGGFNQPFDRSSAPANWQGYAEIRGVDGGGWGHVAIGSFVKLTNGAICYSGSPGTDF